MARDASRNLQCPALGSELETAHVKTIGRSNIRSWSFPQRYSIGGAIR